MSTILYPPVPAPTLDQELLGQVGARVHPSQYKTLDFPPAFQSIYGRPTIAYRAWARLWGAPSSHILEAVARTYPCASSNFLGFAGYAERFVEFCLEVDSCCGGRGRRRDGGDGAAEGVTLVVGRLEMEGAWVKLLLGLFDEMRGAREKMRAFVGMRGARGEGRLLMTIGEVEGEMREVLREAVAQRFGPEAEEYWARKWKTHGYKCPALDVKPVTDWSVEAPFQKSLLNPEDINDNDYDENDDENENENSSHGESNNDLAVAIAMEGIETTQEPMPHSTQEEEMQEMRSEDSDAMLDAKLNMKKQKQKQEDKLSRETLKQEVRFQESNGMGCMEF
ncbi:hypothetical protein DSL72_000300 [Monilinia vaccinii-corymbosi]|uniref:Uncharacterized protein n=1 Tax=Monilinia vaccinii-corymbosi TaxID=61207 RepID=A0A8A3P192_9HELO|nr:hypothetical protein DSL72_000300 [Monilinia vaccinii-corymbosi]